jgi:riboflavin kinase/FMN adenylyltransferase
MELLSWDELQANRSYVRTKAALTIGVYDGLHLGHRKLIEHTVNSAGGLFPVVVTFAGNPHAVLYGPEAKKDILTPDQKNSIIKSLGVKLTVVIDFSLNFSKMSAKIFFKALVAPFQVKKIVVGDNFHFGKNREAGHETLKKMCTEIGAFLEVVETVHFRNLRVSSTRIRHAISEGNFDDVRMMLLDDYCVTIPPDAGEWKGADSLIIRKSTLSQIVPLAGCYHCRINTGDGMKEGIVRIGKESLFVGVETASVKTVCFLKKLLLAVH